MENKQKNPRRRLNSLILLVAFTAIMLIVSTYAWFSSQKNVTIGNLEGKVNVAEGLMVSLDAKSWSQEVDFEDYDTSSSGVATYTGTGAADSKPSLAAIKNGNATDATVAGDGSGLYIMNNVPKELIPVSTTGKSYTANTTTGAEEIDFFNGVNVEGVELYNITKSDLTETDAAQVDFPGYFAIDLFLQNSSKINNDKDNDGVTGEEGDEEQGVTKETLQLNTNSLLELVTGGSTLTGLQNTVRVALAMYAPVSGASKTTATGVDSSVFVTADQTQILKAYDGATISDVAIWEPNADQHVGNIVNANNSIKFTAGSVVDNLYIAATPSTVTATLGLSKFTATEVLPTFALTTTSATTATNGTLLSDGENKGIKDIYAWQTGDDSSSTNPTLTTTTTTDGLERQIALQTDKSTYDYSIISGGVRDLISNDSSGAAIYELGTETGNVKFQMYKNTVVKCRLYVWLEGQDVDCINFASHGSGVHLDLGLIKGQTAGDGAAAS